MPRGLEIETEGAEGTRRFGRALATALEPGDLVLVGGPLGSGKTVLAKGVGEGLGVDEPVVSPTFTLVREYAARVPFVHADVYRLSDLAEFVDLDVGEPFDGRAVTLIEWGDVVGAALPPERLDITIVRVPGAADRRLLSLAPVGRSWEPRLHRLAALCGGDASAGCSANTGGPS